MQNIINSSNLLRFYFKNLLDHSLIEANKLEPVLELKNVNESIKDVLEMMKPQSMSKNIKFNLKSN